MKLITALELAGKQDLKTVDEALLNVILHASRLFIPGHYPDEYCELLDDWHQVMSNSNFNKSSPIIEVIKWIKEKGND